MSHQILIEKLLPATPSQVLQMLTEQKEIEIWTGEEAIFEPKEGGKVNLFGEWMNGEVKKITENELIYTWRSAAWADEVESSLVTFKLSKDGEQTKVILEHSNLPNEEEEKSHKQSWEDYFFVPLEDYLMIRFNAE